MSKNYDNWERLVRAVLRREHDREIALRHSRDTSSISFSSTSEIFDGNDNKRRPHLPMDYSDLTLDHHQWKEMLPREKREVVWKSASQSFFLDPKTGKNCFTFGARKLVTSGKQGSRRKWKMKSHPKSRFSEVAELIDPWDQINISGRIYTQMLSPNTLYAVYLVFGLTESYEKFESTISMVKSSNELDYGYFMDRARMVRVRFESGNRRADEWMEVEMGDCYVGQGYSGTIQVQLMDTSEKWKSGLIVEGIEFRPFGATKTKGKKVET